jgi:Cof subfamily protein (haloacid dehalogenase superfamily)
MGAIMKLIVIDLDNTLLRNDKSISDFSVAVLEECRSKGKKIAFATARSNQAAERSLGYFMPDVFIGYGGALVQVGDEVIYRCAIPSDDAYSLINDCLNEPRIATVLAINETVAHSNLPDCSSLDEERKHYRYVDFTVIDDSINYLKISVVASRPEIVRRIAEKYPNCELVRYTGENLYRFSNINAVKWRAVQEVMSYYDIGQDDVVVFGDDVNDLEMVRECKTSVAVMNAIDDVKAVAKHICESNEDDGVAKWLKEKVLE